MSLLSDEERADIRRHCGYPPLAAGFQGWKLHRTYGLLELRITNATRAEASAARMYLAALAEMEREALVMPGTINAWQRRLCGFMGVKPGPELLLPTPSTQETTT